MPVKMIAVGRYYDRDAAKEYTTGQPFVVANDRIADRLERACRAKRDVVKPAPPVAKPTVATKVMVAETPPPPPPVVTEAPVTTPATDVVWTASGGSGATTTGRSSRYRRNDLRSED